MSRRVLALPKGRSGVVWRFPRRDGFERLRTRTHTHDALEVILVVTGSCVFEIGGERLTLQARSLLWVLPELEHAVIDHTSNLSVWYVGVSPRTVEELKPRIPVLSGSSSYLGLTKVLPSRCVKTLNNVAQELATGFQPLQSQAYLIAWWLTTAWNAFAHGDSQDEGALHPGVSRAMSLLLTDPSRDLTALALAIHLSPSQLSRLFKRQVGMSISGFRNHVRLEQFLRIRPRHKQKVLFGVAKEAGFGSYAQFNRVFRRELGCSPEEYFRSRQSKPPIPRQPGAATSA
ncbi:MAG: AraC family transcriptional regulator [Dehalococcoidia bacterium]